MDQIPEGVGKDFGLILLKGELLRAQRKLKQCDKKIGRQELKEYISDLKNDLGWMLLDSGEFEKGLAIFKSLMWSSHGEAKLNGMIRALVEMGYYDEARRLLEKGLKRFPQSYHLWVARGVLDQRLGYHLESLKCFRYALQYAPEGQSEAQFNVGSALYELGYRDEATKVLTNLVRKYPDEPRYLIVLGACLLEMGYPRDSVKYYKRAMRLGYLSPGLYDGICCAYSRMGLKKEAMEVALEGLRKFPDEEPGLYENLGELYFEMGWVNESRDILNEGIKRFPENEELKKMIKEIDGQTDDPEGGGKPPLLGLILLTLISNKLKKH